MSSRFSSLLITAVFLASVMFCKFTSMPVIIVRMFQVASDKNGLLLYRFVAGEIFLQLSTFDQVTATQPMQLQVTNQHLTVQGLPGLRRAVADY